MGLPTVPSASLDGKRLLDLVGATLGLVVVAPLLAAIAVTIRLGSPGPALFVQERTGRGGKPFRVYKFRTMTAARSDAPDREAVADDPRITRFGRLLRRTGLDELPQLYNVVRGEMSLVGPRPLLCAENALCDARQARRLEVRPGLTGLSQVQGRNAIPWADRVEWDILYVERQSLALDGAILFKTVPTVLFGRNAYYEPAARAIESGATRPLSACAFRLVGRRAT